MLHCYITFFHTGRCSVIHETLRATPYFSTHSLLLTLCHSICINNSCKQFARALDNLRHAILMWILNRSYTNPSRSAIYQNLLKCFIKLSNRWNFIVHSAYIGGKENISTSSFKNSDTSAANSYNSVCTFSFPVA